MRILTGMVSAGIIIIIIIIQATSDTNNSNKKKKLVTTFCPNHIFTNVNFSLLLFARSHQ